MLIGSWNEYLKNEYKYFLNVMVYGEYTYVVSKSLSPYEYCFFNHNKKTKIVFYV